jgi:hypothetical protein
MYALTNGNCIHFAVVQKCDVLLRDKYTGSGGNTNDVEGAGWRRVVCKGQILLNALKGIDCIGYEWSLGLQEYVCGSVKKLEGGR